MAIKLNFDKAGNLETPTFVLAMRSGKRLGVIQNPQDVIVSDVFGDPTEFSFSVIKDICPSWQLIRNLRFLWIREWDKWFELTVDVNESDKSTKNIIATHLPEALLSQKNLYGVEINTDSDIDRTDYVATVFFNESNHDASLLHRITKNATTFRFGHIDDSLKNIQRTFTFDKKNIYDAYKEIEKELDCHFDFQSYTENDKIVCEINAYDLKNVCHDCGERFEYTSTCPECGSKNVKSGYGEDTSVYLSLDNALDSVSYTTDVDSIKNCIRLEAGDDLMTDTIRSCNPNGTNQLFYFPAETLEEMSDDLQAKIDSYTKLYKEYTNTKQYEIDATAFNKLVEKYTAAPYNADDLETITVPVTGFVNLMNAFYNAIDMNQFLTSGLLPSPENDSYTAESELKKLSVLTSVAVKGTVSVSSATNAVEAMAKAIIMSGYQIKTSDQTLSKKKWTGKITLKNYADEDDTAASTFTVTINTSDEAYEEFVNEQIQKTLAKGDSENYGITGLFDKNLADFKLEIKKYGLEPLLCLQKCCEGGIGILSEQGILNKENYDTLNALDPDANKHLYNEIALPFLQKQEAITAEIRVRENEIATVTSLRDKITTLKSDIQKILNFESYLGEDLWAEFSMFRRDDVYSNTNYISDGLDNAEIFRQANEFLKVANQEVQKAATPQHSISVSMKNILVMPQFAPMKEKFSVGNWIRVEANAEVHKLRLLSYEFKYSDYTGLPVKFSDVVKFEDSLSDVESVLNNAKSMATSFDYVAHQASKGEDSYKVQEDWVQKGLDATALNIMNNSDDQTMYFDRYGFLMRKTNDFTGEYEPQQLKFINTTLALTDDNWKTIKAAVGLFQYYDPVTGKLKEGWGLNGETIIGKLILGEELGIYNKAGTLKFNESGLIVTNGTNTFHFDPNSSTLLSIANSTGNIFYVDDKGVLHIKGDGAGLDISSNDSIKGLASSITQSESSILASVSKTYATNESVDNKVTNAVDSVNKGTDEKLKNYATVIQLTSSINISEGNILSKVEETYVSSDSLTATLKSYSTIEQTKDSISLEVKAINDVLDTKVGSDEIISKINLSPEKIQISAKYINLNGAVTANEYFKINEDGSMSTIAGYIGNWIVKKYTIHAQKSTQKTQTVTKPVTDENGDIVYDTVLVYDDNGNPVYETDENGNYVYDYVYDSEGNPVYETDENGDIIYDKIPIEDEEGNITYISEARIKKDKVQKTIEEIVYEDVEEDVDTFYNTYTILSSNDKKVAIAAGVDQVDEDGIPIAQEGKFKVFNDGLVTTTRLTIDKGTEEPAMILTREKNAKTLVAKMYMRDYSKPQIAFSFKKDQSDSAYTFSTIIDEGGVKPYTKEKFSLGEKNRRWGNIYTKNIDITGIFCASNKISMRDDKNRKRDVIRVKSVGEIDVGSNLLISAGGNTMIGSGNSPNTIYTALFATSTAENLALCSDTTIHFYVDCQNGDYNAAYLDAKLCFKPAVNATGSIGKSSARWNSAYFEHAPIVTSDARHKTDIKPIQKAKELIMAIEPCQFKFKRSGADRLHYGLISQDFKKTLDKLGIENCGAWACDLTPKASSQGKTFETATEDEKLYGMRYEELIAPLISVVQEQQKEIEELKEMVKKLVS